MLKVVLFMPHKLIAYYRTLNPELQIRPHQAFARTECPGRTWDSWGMRLVDIK